MSDAAEGGLVGLSSAGACGCGSVLCCACSVTEAIGSAGVMTSSAGFVDNIVLVCVLVIDVTAVVVTVA